MLEFVAGLECKTACTAAVKENGDLKVTLTSDGPEGATVVTTVKLESDTVAVRVDWTTPHGDDFLPFDPAPVVYADPQLAQMVATDIIEGVPADFSDVFPHSGSSDPAQATSEAASAISGGLSNGTANSLMEAASN